MQLFKIRRKKDGLFSKGGRDADYSDRSWSKDGKVWTDLSNVQRHLRLFDTVPDDWQIIELKTSVVSRKKASRLVKGKAPKTKFKQPA